jgi:parallel beta-helix repeat protein
MTYRLFVTGNVTDKLKLRLTNRVTGKPPALEQLAEGVPIGEPTAWHVWRFTQRPAATHRFSGNVHLTETLRIPPGDSVVAEPGTTFTLDPNVSFVSKGAVRFEGSKDRPIRVVPAVAGQPWGAFSLMGSGTDGSIFRHVEFIEGGGALVDRVEYIGMVNVHRARGVVFDSVLFMRNRRSDDTMHFVHSEFTMTNSRFVEANGDALDLDISTGLIRDNVFEGSGGDAIDLMTSTPTIIGNRIRNAGDKGISVGEASAPIIFANSIESSPIGIEIKDQSTPIILNNDINNNKLGLGSKVKNWQYGGSGFGFVANTRLKGNEKAVDADQTSRLTAVAVAGLDRFGTDAPAPAELSWLYGRLGIKLDQPCLGIPAHWQIVGPVPPVVELRFVDDFQSIADEWNGSERVTTLDKRHDALVAEAEGGAATISRNVDWDIGSGLLAVALAGRDLQRVRIEVEGQRGTVARDLVVPDDQSRFAILELPLPADRYRRISVHFEPIPGLTQIQATTGLTVVRAGRVSVRSVAVYTQGAVTMKDTSQ